MTSGDAVWLPSDPRFPEVLLLDPEPPSQLYVRGNPALLERRRVAIIGTRQCTAYGRNVARRMGAELAEAGVVVISGLAIGIDGAAHEGALAADGAPIGVVATGLDVVYPRRHVTLWDQVGRRGLLLSEAPPGRSADRWNFPKRNRIIAALAEIVVVVESAAKGGSMHTVEAAIARGVDVMAVPGPVGSPASEGTNRLLVDGVSPALGADEVLIALNLTTTPRFFLEPKPARARLSASARAVLGVLDFVSMTTDRVVAESGLARGEAMVALQELHSSGKATGGGGWWSRAPNA